MIRCYLTTSMLLLIPLMLLPIPLMLLPIPIDAAAGYHTQWCSATDAT
jgi:hypothetical protein